jgi:hypothetical protein
MSDPIRTASAPERGDSRSLLAGPLPLRVVIAGAAAVSGISFFVYLLLRWDLRLSLGAVAVALGTAAALVWRRLAPSQRASVRKTAAIGIAVGVVSTLAYDTSKWALVQLGGFGESPFGALPKFGALLLGNAGSQVGNWIVGSAFHAINGITFAIAFLLLVPRPTPLRGLVFALVLEAVQVAFYPGWLDPQSVAEFTTISAFGHVVYGLTLGALGRLGLRRGGIA